MDTSSDVPYSANPRHASGEQPQSLDYLERQVARLRMLQEISHKLNSKLDLEGVLTAVLDEAIRTVGAERGCLFVVDAATGKLEVRLSRHFPARGLDDKSFRLSRTVVERVWRDGQPVLTANAAEDPELTKAESVIKYTLRSILCVPLHLQEQRIGVLYLDNRLKAGQFQEDDLALAKAIADQAALALHNAQLHARNRQMAIEQERHRLARDLHDSVTQSLYSIALAAQSSLRLLDQTPADSQIRDALEHIQVTSRIALAEMREQLYDLYPTPLGETGLVEALTQHCEFLRRHHSLQIELAVVQEPALSASLREALYYIAREALWNAVKHAEATRIDVSLAIEDDHVTLSIADDGVGFETSSLPPGKTMGLRNMRERTKQLGGAFDLVSRSGQGTRVTVQFPRQS